MDTDHALSCFTVCCGYLLDSRNSNRCCTLACILVCRHCVTLLLFYITMSSVYSDVQNTKWSAISLVLIQCVYRDCRMTTDSESDKPGSKPTYCVDFSLLAPQIASLDRTCHFARVLCAWSLIDDHWHFPLSDSLISCTTKFSAFCITLIFFFSTSSTNND